jgi:hypothetical protein
MISWLKINEHTNLGMGEEFCQNEIMIKEMGDKKLETGNLDFLGYLY